MTISKIDVMDQRTILGDAGQRSCGIHTLKNSLLFLLFDKKIITNDRFRELANSEDFFIDLNAMIETKKIPTIDTNSTQFAELTEMIHAGEFDLSNYGITSEHLKSLNLARDGNQGISVFELSGFPGEPCYSLHDGHPLGLLNAAASAKFMRSKESETHVFSVGMAKGSKYGHWITAIVTKDATGERTWQFMDSWGNDASFSRNVINLIEKVLVKKESQLQAYLIGAYDVATDFLNRRYELFFDNETHTIRPDVKIDLEKNGIFYTAKQFYLEENLDIYSHDLGEMLAFMKTSGWLVSTGKEETIRKKQLYAIANFILDNVCDENVALKEKLDVICKEIKASLSLPEKNDPMEDLPENNANILAKKETYAKHLGLLQKKIDALAFRMNSASLKNGETSKYQKLKSAFDAAELLHQHLTAAGNIYFNEPSAINYQTFKDDSKQHINKALEELGEHRELTEFLTNLALGFATLGVGILIKGAINYANNRHFLFVCKTDSEKETDKLMECISSSAPVA